MNSSRINLNKHLLAILVLSLGVGISALGQGRGGGAAGGGGGGGGRSGGSSSTTARVYPNNSSIGDAYFSIDPESRRVVTIADAETTKAISLVLSNLDRPKPQVLIKVVFIEVTHNDDLDFGIEGGFTKNVGQGNTANGANVFGLGGLSSAATNVPLNSLGQPVSSFTAASPMTAGGAGLYQMLGQDYQVTLRAIAQAGRAKVLSKPSILARNNQPATITVGQSVPLITSVSYTTFGNPINAVTYTDVGVILSVTPFITSDGLVEMIVAPQISSIDPTLTVPISASVSAPVIDIRSANTVAVTPDGVTVVIGGLMQDSKSTTDTKIPLLGDIPVLGNLFKRQQKSNSKTELLIFLTPHIVQAPSQLAALSAREAKKSEGLDEFKQHELDQYLESLPITPKTLPSQKK
jgi:general secretion pathway protein D